MLRGTLTDCVHHAGLAGEGLHGDDVLEAVQGDDTLVLAPHLQDVLHLGAQFLKGRDRNEVRHKRIITL